MTRRQKVASERHTLLSFPCTAAFSKYSCLTRRLRRNRGTCACTAAYKGTWKLAPPLGALLARQSSSGGVKVWESLEQCSWHEIKAECTNCIQCLQQAKASTRATAPKTEKAKEWPAVSCDVCGYARPVAHLCRKLVRIFSHIHLWSDNVALLRPVPHLLSTCTY